MPGQANAVSDLERAEHLGYADGKGVKRVSVFNDGVQTNIATEETQIAVKEAIENITIPAPEGGATSDNQTDGSQKTQIVDSEGNTIDSFGTPGGATESKQDTGNTALANIYTELQQKTEPTDEQHIALESILTQILYALQNPPYIDKSANAIRNQVQSGTVTTVTTVTNLTNFGSQAADVTYRINSLNSWANLVQPRL